MLALLALAGTSFPAPARADLSANPSAGPAKARPTVETVARKANKPQNDPFDENGDGANASHKGKGSGDSNTDKSADKSAKGSDPLDSLLNDAVSDKSSKGKKDNKEMDALLKDVQKTDPTLAAKKDSSTTSAPPLSSADISAAMAQVKVRGNACAQKFGRSGTAELKITVAKDGKVTDVQVSGKLAGTPIVACIEQAVKTAAFRPNAGLRFDYRMDVH